MRRPFLILFFILVALSIPVSWGQAQNDWWEDGCDPRAIEDIADTTTVVDYEAACGVYRTCDPNNQGDVLCQMRALQFMLEQCPANDMICTDGAMLYAAAILIYDEPLQESISWIPPDSVIEGVPQALRAYWAGDYQAALDAYNLTPREDYPNDTMLPFSRAIIYQHLDQPEQALAEYEQTFSVAFDQPITWYARSQLYGALGRTDEASFDVLALSIFLRNTPELASLVEPLEAQYSAAKDQLEDWILYPVTSVGDGVVGSFVSDLTLEPGRPVQVAMFPELNSIITVGFQNWSASSLQEPTIRVYRLTSTDGIHYHFAYPSYWENSGSVGITIEDSVVSGSEGINYFEGGARWSFMLGPADEPDPRLTIASDARFCPDGVISRVNVGSRIRTVYHGTGISVADQPGVVDTTPYEGNGPREMVIIDGPECVEDEAWWQALGDEGTSGWVAENVGNTYYIAPSTADPSTFVCADSPPIGLIVGENGRVIPGTGANNLRELPDIESAIVDAIPEDGTFSVSGGPVCADDLTWWYVDYVGTVGWTVEGQGDVYWLEPMVE